MESIENCLVQNQTLTLIVAFIGLVVLVLSLKRISTKIVASNRGVSIGGNSNVPITTGDINANRSGCLSSLANIATILGLLVGAATLYVTYLSLIKVG